MAKGADESPKKKSTSNGQANTFINLRKDFPITWIWEDILNDNCDAVTLSQKVPDTITSWLITAFSLNKADGLGVSEHATTLKVFRPFFISTTLPYSVKRGEQLTLSIQIFNYLSSDQDVSVTMFNEGQQFEFTNNTDSKNGEFINRATKIEQKKLFFHFRRLAITHGCCEIKHGIDDKLHDNAKKSWTSSHQNHRPL
jgi:uncharacterized protein YfaS (alpha-2-macroglobulin family)